MTISRRTFLKGVGGISRDDEDGPHYMIPVFPGALYPTGPNGYDEKPGPWALTPARPKV